MPKLWMTKKKVDGNKKFKKNKMTTQYVLIIFQAIVTFGVSLLLMSFKDFKKQIENLNGTLNKMEVKNENRNVRIEKIEFEVGSMKEEISDLKEDLNDIKSTQRACQECRKVL